MQYDFLRYFPRRMKKVGAYALLIKASVSKGTWKDYGFEEFDEQINLLFSIMLFMMETSLKEEHCTVDEIGNFIDQVNLLYFKKSLTYEECKELARYIIDVILGNDGKPFCFQGFNFQESTCEEISLRLIGHRTIYTDAEIKRTSYYLTDEGYNLLLSTLEVDSHMQLTIQQLIFKLHLEKASYDKAVESIKQVFDLLRIQFQKIVEDMDKIRRNALAYSLDDYQTIVKNNLITITDTKARFLEYKDHVKRVMTEFEDREISAIQLSDEEQENLKHLKTINGYLNKTLDEHQKIFNSHLDLKALYSKELQNLTQMIFVKRFNLRTDLDEHVLDNVALLGELDYFLRPLFQKDWEQTYNINKAITFQHSLVKQIHEDESFVQTDETQEEDDEYEKRMQRLESYRSSLTLLFTHVINGGMHLARLQEQLSSDEVKQLIPTAEIFKEIMVDLLQEKVIDLPSLRREQQGNLYHESLDFNLGQCILQVLSELEVVDKFKEIIVTRLINSELVVFDQVLSEDGCPKKIQCSDVLIEVK